MDSYYKHPEFTNFVGGFAFCLDYIFYRERQASVVELLEIPKMDEIRDGLEKGELPNSR